MEHIYRYFPVTDEEYMALEERYGKLTKYQSWQLIRKNNNNNHTEDPEDFFQDLSISLLRAGSYFKRQTYIERCLQLCGKYAKDRFLKRLIKELRVLWGNKTRHGANRQKFGPHQEKLLAQLVRTLVPPAERPARDAPLLIDHPKFRTYCKAITWNEQKAAGKKITREKSLRAGQVSLSEYDYLSAAGSYL
jgi:hypothetical protein